MRVIHNLPSLPSVSGEPMTLRVGEEMQTPSIAKWIIISLNSIPGQLLTMVDATHHVSIMRKCSKADDGEVVKKDIELEQDEYAWLMRMLFDDAKGVELSTILAGKTGTPFRGAWLLGCLSPQAVMLLKSHLESEPSKLGTGE